MEFKQILYFCENVGGIMKESMSNIGNLFALSKDPVVCVDNGKITYMNPPAIHIFGVNMMDKPENVLLPAHLLSIDSDSFVASAIIRGQNMTVSRSSYRKKRLYSFALASDAHDPSALESVSASLRELTNSIKATSDLISVLSADYGDPTLDRYTAVLRHMSAKMKRLVNNYGMYSAFHQKTQIYNPSMASLGMICRRLCDEIRPIAKREHIYLEYVENSDLICQLDHNLMTQLILNLLCNSLNHMPKGGLLRVEVSASESYMILSVEDNGTGIPPEVLVNVFNAYSSPAALTGEQYSAGLGLTVADIIAKLHAGSIIIESRPGRGTRVVVQIPIIIDGQFMSPEHEYTMDTNDHILTGLSTWLSWEDYSPNSDET